MEHNFLDLFDGTGRVPRQAQAELLSWLSGTWDKSNIFAIQAPTGLGKSGCVRAIQLLTDAHVIVPSNVLLNQLLKDYPGANYLKGKEHYECKDNPEISCADVQDLQLARCANCTYADCKSRALRGEPTLFNPISLHYLQKNEGWVKPKVIVVDEAHKLKDMLLLLCTKSFGQTEYNIPDATDEFTVVKWLDVTLDKLHNKLNLLLKAGRFKEAAPVNTQIRSLNRIARALTAEPHKFSIERVISTRYGRAEPYLNITPLSPPLSLVREILDCEKLILLSGTLSRFEVNELVGYSTPYEYLDLPSPIPKENRTVHYRPTPYPLSLQTDPKQLAASIEDIIRAHPGLNTIVHCTYALSERISKHFTIPVLTNTPKSKEAVLKKFRKQGGVWLASGVSEGIDLPGKLCELNIIPQLHRPNLGSTMVAKRKALPDGQLWYDLECLKLAIQQAGRSSRSEKDKSIIYVMDPLFSTCVLKNLEHIPISFKEAIAWPKKEDITSDQEKAESKDTVHQ